MSTKLKIGDVLVELPRGAPVPKNGDVLYIKLKGDSDEKGYTVDLVEHEFDFNMPVPIGITTITLQPIRSIT